MMKPRTPRRWGEQIIVGLFALSTLTVIVPIMLIFGYLFSRGLGAISWEFLTQPPRERMSAGGIGPVLLGTLYLLGGTLLFSLPVGVMAAIYLTEYARDNWFRRLVHLAIVNLAGVPSVVYGLFGLGLFVLALKLGASILASSLTLSLLILPIVITATEEALLAVPRGFREGSLALGATKWQTVWRMVIPNALPGIVTGMIIGLSRAAGETAPILFTGVAFYLPQLPQSAKDQFMALPYHLFIMATQATELNPRIVWGTAVTLLLLVLGMNGIATVIRMRFLQAKKW
jgi:phosphate transport system permease protein